MLKCFVTAKSICVPEVRTCFCLGCPRLENVGVAEVYSAVRSPVCPEILIRSALESADPGAFDGE